MKIERTNYHHMFLLLTVKKNSVYYQLHDGEEYVLSKIMYVCRFHSTGKILL